MNDYHLRTDSLIPGPRRDAIVTIDEKIASAERDLNRAIDSQLWRTATLARNDLKALREQRAYLFTCSIHTILAPEPSVSDCA
jgi:hypothetical protein